MYCCLLICCLLICCLLFSYEILSYSIKFPDDTVSDWYMVSVVHVDSIKRGILNVSYSPSPTAHNSTTASYSMSSSRPGMELKHCLNRRGGWGGGHGVCGGLCGPAASAGCDLCPGWIIQPQQQPCDEPQQFSLRQWVLERQAAASPECVAAFSLKHVCQIRGYIAQFIIQ